MGFNAWPLLYALVRVVLLGLAAYWAWDIRMLAIREYGRLIHEVKRRSSQIPDPLFGSPLTRTPHLTS
jgi:hypothetical protein